MLKRVAATIAIAIACAIGVAAGPGVGAAQAGTCSNTAGFHHIVQLNGSGHHSLVNSNMGFQCGDADYKLDIYWKYESGGTWHLLPCDSGTGYNGSGICTDDFPLNPPPDWIQGGVFHLLNGGDQVYWNSTLTLQGSNSSTCRFTNYRAFLEVFFKNGSSEYDEVNSYTCSGVTGSDDIELD